MTNVRVRRYRRSRCAGKRPAEIVQNMPKSGQTAQETVPAAAADKETTSTARSRKTAQCEYAATTKSIWMHRANGYLGNAPARELPAVHWLRTPRPLPCTVHHEFWNVRGRFHNPKVTDPGVFPRTRSRHVRSRGWYKPSCEICSRSY